MKNKLLLSLTLVLGLSTTANAKEYSAKQKDYIRRASYHYINKAKHKAKQARLPEMEQDLYTAYKFAKLTKLKIEDDTIQAVKIGITYSLKKTENLNKSYYDYLMQLNEKYNLECKDIIQDHFMNISKKEYQQTKVQQKLDDLLYQSTEKIRRYRLLTALRHKSKQCKPQRLLTPKEIQQIESVIYFQVMQEVGK